MSSVWRPAIESDRVGVTPTRDENMGLWLGSRRVSIAKVRVLLSTSWGGLEGYYS